MIWLLMPFWIGPSCIRSTNPVVPDVDEKPPIQETDVMTSPAENLIETSDSTHQEPTPEILPSASPQEDPPPSDPPERSAQNLLDESLGFCEASSDFWEKGDLENALLALDKAYGLMLEADVDDDPQLIQQKEDLRLLISKRILQIHASRRTTVSGKHHAIPLDDHEEIRLQIKLFQTSQRNFFLNAINRSGMFRPMIVDAIEKAGLPKELSWLPLIESGFKIRALSPARALGLWQFIPSTGYRFGLKRDEWIDERMDPEKSTQAAIAYLQELHEVFGDWCTVLAAYNCGENRVLRIIRQQKTNYLDHFWDLYFKLPIETRQYVPRYLAALTIIQDPQKYGFDFGDLDVPIEFDTMEISRQLRLADIARVIHVDPKTLETLNPELRRQITPASLYTLKVPTGTLGTESGLDEKIASLPIFKPPVQRWAYHRIRSGDTLSHLAVRYRTSIEAIARANHMRTTALLQLGKRLRIPVRGSQPPSTQPAPAAPKPKENPMTVRHTIQSGDSLWSLAQHYNTTVDDIKRRNDINTEQLNLGQELVIEKNPPNGKPPSRTKNYLVKSGDSPYSIASEHSMELEHFLRINQLTPTSKIYPGQHVLVDEH